MKLREWLDQDERAPAEDATPRGVEEAIVLEHLQGKADAPTRPWRLIVLVLLLGLLVVLFQPLSSRATRFAPPIAAVGDFLMNTSDAWEGHAIFPVDRSSALLAAMADGTYPRPQRAWPDVRALPLDTDLYAVGPDLNGAMMYYAIPGPAGHSWWLASPGPDGVWSAGAEHPREVAAAIDLLARRIETETLANVSARATPGPWSYNVRWGDDHIVLFHVMLVARGRLPAVRERLDAAQTRLAVGPRAPVPIEALDLPALWADEADAAAALLAAIQADPAPAPARAAGE